MSKEAWSFVTEAHEPIRQLLIPFRGAEITNDQWKELVQNIPGIGAKWKLIQPTDHCSNVRNIASCKLCADTGQALVTRVRRGKPSIFLVR